MEIARKFDKGKIQPLNWTKQQWIEKAPYESYFAGCTLIDRTNLLGCLEISISMIVTRCPTIVGDVVLVSENGTEKYGLRNYAKGRGIEWSRLANAAMRHLLHKHDVLDNESGLPHGAHALWNLSTLRRFILDGHGINDLTQ